MPHAWHALTACAVIIACLVLGLGKMLTVLARLVGMPVVLKGKKALQVQAKMLGQPAETRQMSV